ncbi:hypothetical protein COB57_04855 [Candidatus Peregrinibacteria bacterium]|nr:MAG: hypothetical protein COB57_04855 [Candidatus Peregrinibacteria bacterium]
MSDHSSQIQQAEAQAAQLILDARHQDEEILLEEKNRGEELNAKAYELAEQEIKQRKGSDVLVCEKIYEDGLDASEKESQVLGASFQSSQGLASELCDIVIKNLNK